MENVGEGLLIQLKRIANSLETISQAGMFRVPVPDVYGIGMLTAEEYNIFKNRLSPYRDNWWLDSKRKDDTEALFVTENGAVEKTDINVNWIYVRPCLRITNGFEFEYKQSVKVGKYTFMYLGENILLSTVGIKTKSYKEIEEWKRWEWENLVTGAWDWVDNRERVPRTLDITLDTKDVYVTFVSEKEFRRLKYNIPIVESPYWLRENANGTGGALVENGADVTSVISDYTRQGGIRPALYLKACDYDLHVRERVLINRKPYTYIGENYLLSDMIVGNSVFDRSGREWKDSDIRKWLNQDGRNALLAKKGA